MTSELGAALAVEARKLLASRVVLVATFFLIGGIALLAGSLTAAAEAGNEQVLDQLGELADRRGWDRLLGVVAQITAAGGLLGFGTVLSWSVGREFAEGTISGLFALPVRRSTIVAAKLVVYVVWAAAVAFGLVVVSLVVGLAVGIGPPDVGTAGGLGRVLGLAAMSALLAFPAAWAATLGRGLLPGIATTIGTIVVAQVIVVADAQAGAWFPLTAPALWALDLAEVRAAQLALVAVVPVGFGALAMRAWGQLQLDR